MNQVIAIDGNFPGPILEVTTNWNVVVNVKNNLDEPLLLTWYVHVLKIRYTCSTTCNNSNVCAGMEFSTEETHGKMVCQGQIVLFLLVGIGHMFFRLKIR